jgi:hypothetical protein
MPAAVKSSAMPFPGESILIWRWRLGKSPCNCAVSMRLLTEFIGVASAGHVEQTAVVQEGVDSDYPVAVASLRVVLSGPRHFQSQSFVGEITFHLTALTAFLSTTSVDRILFSRIKPLSRVATRYGKLAS